MSKTLEILKTKDKVHRMVELISFNEPYVTVLGHDSHGESMIDSVLEKLGGDYVVSINDVDDLRQVHRDRRIDSVINECEEVSNIHPNLLAIRLERKVDDTMLQDLRNKVRQISHQAREIGIRVIFISQVNKTLPGEDSRMSFVGGSQVIYGADLAIVAIGENVEVIKNRYGIEELL
jgi:hypothetical protein